MQEKHSRGIERVLALVSSVTGNGAVFHELKETKCVVGKGLCRFCETCLNHPVGSNFCRYSCCNATVQSLSCGEPYFYQCWAGLLFITVAVAPKGRCIGGISLGGFWAEGEQSDAIPTLSERLSQLPATAIDHFSPHLESIREITPSALRGLGAFILESTFSEGLNSPGFLEQQNARYQQQRQIAEAYESVRMDHPSPPDILQDAYHLVSYLERHDRQNALNFISTYLAKLLLVSNWDTDKLKAHLRVLLAIITSQEILRGRSWVSALSREMQFLTRLEQAQTTEDSCYEIAALIQEHFAQTSFDRPDALQDRAIAWLRENYHRAPTLTAAARALGVSVSTLVHQLKARTGKTFGRLLRDVRISEAKKLLATTDMDISAISQICGFSDQSHFTKQLKSAVNLTPGQFRRLLKLTKDVI